MRAFLVAKPRLAALPIVAKPNVDSISEVCTGDSDYTWGDDVDDEGVAAAEAPLLEDGMNVGSAEATLAVRKACMKKSKS